jgi:hypothetical protein
MECDFASVLLAHTAQFFGTNEYATDITTDSIAAGAEVCVYIRMYIHTYIHTYTHTYIHTYTHTIFTYYTYIQVNVKDTAGRTPLHMAAAYGATPVARLLLEKGADPDVQVRPPNISKEVNNIGLGIIVFIFNACPGN